MFHISQPNLYSLAYDDPDKIVGAVLGLMSVEEMRLQFLLLEESITERAEVVGLITFPHKKVRVAFKVIVHSSSHNARSQVRTPPAS